LIANSRYLHLQEWRNDLSFNDFAELVPGLFVGSHPEPEDPFELGADVVVCLASGTSVKLVPRGTVLVHWPIKDGPVPPPAVLRSLARFVDTSLREEAAVYVHCQAGMNRSVLVAARVLMERGMTAEQAIELVRNRRSGSLSDEYADWLRAEEVATKGAEAR
jgi:protein-tyrosine phosphatase